MNPGAASTTKWKLPYLKNYITQNKNESFPIIALTETWLKSHITDTHLQITGYDLLRCDRSLRRGGGVLLYLSEQLPPTNVEVYDDKVCQAIACICDSSKTIIILVYRPPDTASINTNNLMKFIKQYIVSNNNDDSYDIMMLGDFNLPNISWSTSTVMSGFSVAMNDAAENILEIMNENFLNQYITVPTRGSNILDLCMTNNDSLIQDVKVSQAPLSNSSQTPLSDHKIIKIVLTNHPAYEPIVTPKIFENYSFRSLNLDESDWPSINNMLDKIDY